MQFFTTEAIGPKRALTPSGALICYEVPIARTGLQLYKPGEIQAPDGEPELEPGPNGSIEVERVPEEVFAPETIASFEGVPITWEHPSFDVTPTNWRLLAYGQVTNVRRGEGVQDHLMLADLVIQDEQMIQFINDAPPGQGRQVSLGYSSDYESLGLGRAKQKNIRGNHCAVLGGDARCGPQCSIQDADPAAAVASLRRRRAIHHVHLHL